jgi:hypothetical protein
MALLSILFIVTFSLPTWASFSVKNGGDAIVCRRVPGARFVGLYSLDYLLTYSNIRAPLAKVSSWDASADRLKRLMGEKLPELYMSFSEFASQYRNADSTKRYLWLPSTFGLEDLKDEDIVGRLPKNCRLSSSKAKLRQAVIRQPGRVSGRPPAAVTFEYDPNVLKQLEAKDPLQLSFLLVHEWLWSISDNVNVNRQVIRYLHSREMEASSAEKISRDLAGYGFAVGSLASDVLQPRPCPADPSAIPLLFPGPDVALLFPDFTAREYERSCSVNGCSAPVEKAAARIDKALDPDEREIVLNGQNFVDIASPAAKIGEMTNMRCSVNLGTAQLSCSSLIDTRLNDVLEPSAVFSGTLNATCLRLEARSKGAPDANGNWTDVTTVLYRRF